MLLRVDNDVDHFFSKKTDPNNDYVVIEQYENKSSNGTQRHSIKTS